MPDKTIHINSSSHFSTTLAAATYNVVDFYADWCGPCKSIAPVFNALAEKEAKPGKLQFLKVNVDSCQDVARKYGVSAMPTFLIFKSGAITDTIRGANPSELKAAVLKVSNAATAGPAARGLNFSSKGYTLGSSSTPSRPVGAGAGAFSGLQGMVSGNGGLVDMVVRFVALYFISLLSFDSYKAAEDSPFAVRRRR